MVGWEAIAGMFGKNAGTEDLEAFYPVRPECKADIPKTRFRPRVCIFYLPLLLLKLQFNSVCMPFFTRRISLYGSCTSSTYLFSQAGKTLSARRWHAAFSEDGHLDIAKVLRRIQRGGIHPSIKGLVWEFLLGCFDPNSSFEDRNQLRQQRRERYGMWKTECQNMVPVIGSGKFITTPIITDDGQPIEDGGWHVTSAVADKKVAQWMLSLHQIGLDVVRTDRALTFYENETNQAKLWDVLAIYSWVDDDIGYVQGMNDICSPMVILLENEADAFWCFERAMRKLLKELIAYSSSFWITKVLFFYNGLDVVCSVLMSGRENFRCSTNSIGVQSQLSTLSQVIRTVDPKLHQHLEDLDGGEYLFAFRMLMVLFRREFSFIDALYLWEVMWAMEYNPNIFSSYELPSTASDSNSAQTFDQKLLKQYGKFERINVKNGHTDKNSALAVYLAASVLESKNKVILKEAKGLDDVVKVLYSLSISLLCTGCSNSNISLMMEAFSQIMGDITGNLDAKKACKEALKIQNKYLKKAKKS
ncbi:Rab-GAP-TBC domain - like 2 [Theobroma cacao]|nr:Rab-GAP-TBC domain - like 2 [Theobroma cacao]